MEGRFLITEYKNKKMAFLFEEERLVKVHFLDKSSIVGNIYTAKVVNKIKSIDAVFLNIGTSDYLYYPLADNENNHIFLHHGNSDKVNIGDEILVQVSKDYIKSKGDNHHVVFLVDEIGQYIGEDGSLMLNLQTIVEDLGIECGGKAWVYALWARVGCNPSVRNLPAPQGEGMGVGSVTIGTK